MEVQGDSTHATSRGHQNGSVASCEESENKANKMQARLSIRISMCSSLHALMTGRPRAAKDRSPIFFAGRKSFRIGRSGFQIRCEPGEGCFSAPGCPGGGSAELERNLQLRLRVYLGPIFCATCTSSSRSTDIDLGVPWCESVNKPGPYRYEAMALA